MLIGDCQTGHQVMEVAQDAVALATSMLAAATASAERSVHAIQQAESLNVDKFCFALPVSDAAVPFWM